jgi:dolichyl-diphosphooligosaccharide--protein glycosyltransferase
MYAADSFQTSFLLRHQRYYESQMVRLYEFHGSSMPTQPVVVDYDERQVSNPQTGEQFTVNVAPGGNQPAVRTFRNMSAAREFVRQDGTAQIGGVGPYPEERVPALEHYRLVKASNSSALNSRGYVSQLRSTMRTTNISNFRALFRTEPSFVKTFERVPGATIEGSGAPPNSTITASAQFRVPTTNETFSYSQQATADENGEFTMTLPYSTTEYDEYGPENGYTNVSVRATTDHYTLSGPSSFNGTHVIQYGRNVTVPEGAVNGAEAGVIETELRRETREVSLQQNVTAGGADSESGAGSGSGSGSGDVTAPTGVLDGTDSGGTHGGETAVIREPARVTAPRAVPAR